MTAVICARQPQQLDFSTCQLGLLGDQPWATDHSLSTLHGHGTVCRQPYRAASSLNTFRREMKTFIYYSSFLDH